MKFIVIFSLIYVSVSVAAAGYNGPTNQAGLDLIKEFEGWKPNFYTDPVGIKTIGYGHACHVSNCNVPINGIYPVPLSLANGEALLKSDLPSYEKCVVDNVKANLNANQFSALTSWVFNLGCGNLRSSDMLRLLNAGDVKGASADLILWNKAGGVTLAGLVRRREAERALFCTGGICSTSSTCIGSVSATSLYIRSSPSSTATLIGSLTQWQSVTISGRVSGENVSGNSYWFQVSNGYVSAYYIQITSSGASWCAATACIGSVSASSLYIRSSPSSTAASVGSLTQGQSVTILGRVSGQTVSGNANWFQISNGYVSAVYITITSSGGSWCAK